MKYQLVIGLTLHHLEQYSMYDAPVLWPLLITTSCSCWSLRRNNTKVHKSCVFTGFQNL